MPNFQVARAMRDGLQAVLMFDAGLDPREAAKFPHLLTISMPVKNPTRDGPCDKGESDRLGPRGRAAGLPGREFVSLYRPRDVGWLTPDLALCERSGGGDSEAPGDWNRLFTHN